MLAFLPVLAFAFLYVLFQTRSRNWRASFLNAAVAWGTLVVLVSEGLSVSNNLTPTALAVVWSAIDLFLACETCWSLIGFRITPRPALTSHSLNLHWQDFLLLTGVGVIIVLVGFTALLSPPNTSDVMTYHLPRVVHWLQQRSLAFYPTRDMRQLVQPPGAEFCVLQLHALAGSDRFDNLPQWWSFLGSAIGVSLVASELGAGTRGQVVASVVCATIPQGILTASSADSDYVLSFWLVALVWYMLHYSRHPTSALSWGIGSALGLATLTKGTAVVLVAPLLLCLAATWTLPTWKQLMTKIPLVILIVAMINLGYWARNTRRYGFPLDPAAASFGWQVKYTNHRHGLGSIASNVVKNVALHLGTASPDADSATLHIAVAVIHLFGSNENDPATTYPGTAFEIPPLNLDPDMAGNLFHLVLILMTLVIILISPSLRRYRLSLYSLGLVGAFVTFCAVFRWQPWHTRLHLPLFVLWSSIIGVVFERQFRRLMTNILGVALILAAIPATLLNETRPLINRGALSVITMSRERLYFSARPSLFDSYQKAASLITESSCQSVGIDLPGDGYEYPWMVLLDIQPSGRQLHYVGDETTPLGNDSVCAVICMRCRPLRFAVYNSKFGPPRTFETVAVFGPSPPAPPSSAPK